MHLPTLVPFGTMAGGEWGLLCRMRTSSQWYEEILTNYVKTADFSNYNTVSLFSTQTMHHLKQLLDTIYANYTEKTFESEEDVAGLGPKLFVSDSRTTEFVKL